MATGLIKCTKDDAAEKCLVEGGCCMEAKVTEAVDSADLDNSDVVDAGREALKVLGFDVAMDGMTSVCVDMSLKAVWVTEDGKFTEPASQVSFETMCVAGATRAVMTAAAVLSAVAATAF